MGRRKVSHLGQVAFEHLEYRQLLSASGQFVYTFTAGNDGQSPAQGLVADSHGNFFGTTLTTTQNPYGTIFELTPGSTTPTNIYAFSNSAYQGYDRAGSLVVDASGNLYGVATGAYNSDDGRVFEYVKSSNTVVDLAVFNGANGATPTPGLSIDSSGNLFGATRGGGAHGDGTIFEIPAQNHTLKTLYNFAGGNDGDNPSTTVSLDANGNLFGATQGVGSTPNPTIYELATNANSVTTLYTFSGNLAGAPAPESKLAVDASDDVFATTYLYDPLNGDAGHLLEISNGQASAADRGIFPVQVGLGVISSDLIFDASGNLYGGGSGGEVFELPKGGNAIRSAYFFPQLVNTSTGPTGGIVLDANGNLFGASEGGDNSRGTIEEVTSVADAGKFTFAGNGILEVHGTSASDTISVTDVNGTLTAYMDGATNGPFTGITQIQVLGLAGSDSISLANVPVNASIAGSTGFDTIISGGGDDTISGGGGNDYIGGAGGNDSITGGKGLDTIRGGSGNDTLQDGIGSNNFHGGKGNDLIYGGDGADTINGNGGNDTLIAGAGMQQLAGGPGNDSITGSLVNNEGPDTVYSYFGSDVIQLGTNDSIVGQTAGDTVTRG